MNVKDNCTRLEGFQGSSLTDFVSAHFYNSLEHASGQVYYEGELLLTQRPECRRKTEDRR